MSRIGKLPVSIPSGVDATIDGQVVTIKGPKGSLDVTLPAPIVVAKGEDGALVVSRPSDQREHRALHGLSRSLINNMVIGVTEGYTINLEIHGVGYRVLQKGKDLEFALGYSHPVPVKAPEGITFAVDGQTKLSITGIDKQLVGQTAANIRRLRKHDPYKGKGIHFVGEQLRRKVGKTGK